GGDPGEIPLTSNCCPSSSPGSRRAHRRGPCRRVGRTASLAPRQCRRALAPAGTAASRGREDSRYRCLLRRAVLLAPARRPRSRRHKAGTATGRSTAWDRPVLLPGPGREAVDRHGSQGSSPAGPAVDRLLAWADVVYHNLRPGAAERLGLAYDDVSTTHPGLIYLC